MTRRWTPQRFVRLRRIRVAACALAVAVASVGTFAVTQRKAVALNINGETRNVTTYAMTVDRLLEEQGVNVKSHDLVQSTSGGDLTNHDVVTVRSAYQTTISIDGREVPFWTVADSAQQLLSFFNSNEADAAKVTVDINNVYNQLTGGVIINRQGPVTVVADGKSSVAPNGKLPAASILDSKGIVVGKEDRVSVEQDGDTTVLRVRRVTHGQETRTTVVPFQTRTVIDPTLQPGQTVVRQQGQNGAIERVYDVTYVDGKPETETLVSERTTTIAIDQIVAVGPEKVDNPDDTSNGQADAGKNDSTRPDSGKDDSKADHSSGQSKPSGNTNKPADTNKPAGGSQQQPGKPSGGNSGSNGSTGNSGNSGSTGGNSGGQTQQPGKPGNSGGSTGNSGSTGGNSGSGSTGGGSSSSQGRLWHPSIAQAKTYARGAAAQRGWTGDQWDALEWIWTKESGWRWNADNPYSDAYGIPQALPGSKMGPGWQDDGAVQIDWGLAYIAQRYGNPVKAKNVWLQQGWY